MSDEISFDLVMEEDMSFVEGTYRLNHGDWQVFIFSRGDVPEPAIKVGARWESGVTGVHVRWPDAIKLDEAAVKETLARCLGVAEWRVVAGPDSMNLR